MRRRAIERGYIWLVSDRHRAVALAVAKAVGSAALALGSITVGPLFSARWNIVIWFSSIVIQLVAGVWWAGLASSESRENGIGLPDSRATEEKPCHPGVGIRPR
jgi:hypothetical protein